MVYLKKFFDSNKDLLKDNFVLFASNFILGVFGYLYQFYLGRTLGPEQYGIIGALFSIAYIEGVFYNSIIAATTKFSVSLKAKNEYDKLNSLFISLLKNLLVFGIIIFLIFSFFSRNISSFLNISDRLPVILVGSFFIIAVLMPVSRGMLQGLQNFKFLGLNLILEGVTKIIFVILLVELGLGVNGAILALIFSYLIPFIISFYKVRKLIGNKRDGYDIGPLIKYSFPIFLSLLSLTLIFTLDVILAKHFLDPVTAGHYSALSLLGKVIYFVNIPISMVMFTKVSDSYENKKPTLSLFYKSISLSLFISLAITSFFALFPSFTISLLFGKEYYDIKNLVGLFGLFITFFSLSWVTLFYNFSINRTGLVYLVLLFDIAEVILIYLYHQTLLQIVLILLTLTSILFFILFAITILSKNEAINNNTSI